MSQGRVEEIFIFPNRGDEAQSVQMVEALVGDGLDGDHRRHHNRQVSLIDILEEEVVARPGLATSHSDGL